MLKMLIDESKLFQGPSMCKNINNELIELLKADGYTNISQAVGADFK